MQQRLFFIATFLFLGLAFFLLLGDQLAKGKSPLGMIGIEKGGRDSATSTDDGLNTSTGDGSSASSGGATTLPSTSETGTSLLDSYSTSGVDGTWGTTGLVVGLPTYVPDLDEVATVTDVPWSYREVRRAFNSLNTERCEMLMPENPVSPPLVRPTGDEPAPVGRKLAFTVGLSVDKKAESDLPALTGSKIKRYMAEHRLGIEPPIYWSPESGFFLGNRLRAAFFPLETPEQTTAPEPLIATAVKNIRTLGMYEDASGQRGRTLILAFKYSIADPLSTQKTTVEYELLFVHLLPQEEGRPPQITVFATQGGRQEVHELLPDSIDSLDSQNSAVTATVRFDDFTLAGLYPAKPVVTGVRLNSATSLSSELFRRTMNGFDGDDAISLSEMLDKVHADKSTLR